MAVLEREVRSSADPSSAGVRRRLFSRQDYQAMAEAGIFDNERVELVEGEIIQMAPIGDPHAALTDPLAVLLRSAFGSIASSHSAWRQPKAKRTRARCRYCDRFMAGLRCTQAACRRHQVGR